MTNVDVRIRRAEGSRDYLACVALQKKIWGFTDGDDLAASTMLMLSDRFGGCVLVAEDGDQPIGFAFAMPGWKTDMKPFWWSHMTAVLPEYRNRNLGLALKLRQREEALAHGVERIEWTFDPMQSLNAHFNLCKLGVVVHEYEEDVYGQSTSPLHRGLPTDRFVAEWNLREFPRVRGERRDSDILLEIPSDINSLKARDLDAAKAWQVRVRATSQRLFHDGYAVTGFVKVSRSYVFVKRQDC